MAVRQYVNQIKNNFRRKLNSISRAFGRVHDTNLSTGEREKAERKGRHSNVFGMSFEMITYQV